MNLNMKVKPTMILVVRRSLMKGHNIWKRHLPQVIKSNQSFLQHSCEALHFSIAEVREACVSLFWGHVNFIRITRKIRKESNRRTILGDNPTLILFFGSKDVLKEHASGLEQITLAGCGFSLNRFKNKIRGVNLTVRMRIRDAYNFAFVFKYKNMLDTRVCRKLQVLPLPCTKKILNLCLLELGQGEIVSRCVTNYACDAVCWSILIDAGCGRQLGRCI